MYAWKEENKILKYPVFSKSDKTFTGEETILSASIAADRSGNKRAVTRSKESGYLQFVLDPAANFELMDDVYLAWNFQVNFMFEVVL